MRDGTGPASNAPMDRWPHPKWHRNDSILSRTVGLTVRSCSCDIEPSTSGRRENASGYYNAKDMIAKAASIQGAI